MPPIREIGEGYYAIETEGVTIPAEVRQTVETAFKKAKAVPAEDLNIQISPQAIS